MLHSTHVSPSQTQDNLFSYPWGLHSGPLSCIRRTFFLSFSSSVLMHPLSATSCSPARISLRCRFQYYALSHSSFFLLPGTIISNELSGPYKGPLLKEPHKAQGPSLIRTRSQHFPFDQVLGRWPRIFTEWMKKCCSRNISILIQMASEPLFFASCFDFKEWIIAL